MEIQIEIIELPVGMELYRHIKDVPPEQCAFELRSNKGTKGRCNLHQDIYYCAKSLDALKIERGDNLKGDKVLIDRITEKDNIKVINNSTIEKFNEENKILKSVTIKEKGEERALNTKACFIFIGYEPATKFLKNLDILDEKGYIIVDEQKRTPIKGIYAAGDTVKKDAFQIVTATADGAIAAISCIKDLKEV